jgi:hypothetical protein
MRTILKTCNIILITISEEFPELRINHVVLKIPTTARLTLLSGVESHLPLAQPHLFNSVAIVANLGLRCFFPQISFQKPLK